MVYKSRFKENNNLPLFKDLSFTDKVKRLSEYPYIKGRYYHVSNEKYLNSILRSGIKGDEIWVSKDQPYKDYTEGVLFELDLSGYTLKPDVRWKKEDQVYILDNTIIKPKDILKVFSYFDNIDMREDILALKAYKKSKDDIEEIIKEYDL